MVSPASPGTGPSRCPSDQEGQRFAIGTLSRRAVFLGAASSLLAACATTEPGQPVAEGRYANEPFPVRPVDRSRFAAAYRPARVPLATGKPAGTVIVDTKARHLLFVEDAATVMRYGVAVGASGHAWQGNAVVGRKAKWPAWHPTDDMHAQTPGLPRRIEPGPANPLGARGLYLYADGVDTLYRIHGTSEPWTIGTEASSGCIRMINEDIIDLYDRVPIGASVIVA
ncbi:L,D-transpeptidase [Kaistia terrae]|uniref:L,D-transpeptidase n=1 Tax=Kaistia terrae TaxID=537017 RepID=A0ABW0PZY8_9HYPH|nr:L,D-transpeptidase [Kaistia terrae]MCX5580521.1 L,D-transpeptidase [Kaistia terrae]